jgi:hypothetical protein
MNRDWDNLNELLRNVDPPADLADRLRAIPDRPEATLRPRFPIWYGVAGVFATAATLAIIVAGAWRLGLLPTSDDPGPVEVVSASPNSDVDDRKPSMNIGRQPDLQAIRNELADIETNLDALEIGDLRRRLSNDRTESLRFEPDAWQSESLIASLAAQSAFDWGVDSQTVQDEMARVVARFPNSLGAQRASQFLQLQ